MSGYLSDHPLSSIYDAEDDEIESTPILSDNTVVAGCEWETLKKFNCKEDYKKTEWFVSTDSSLLLIL